MEYDWESRKLLLDFSKDIESQWRWNQYTVYQCALLWSKLVCTVARTDGDCERVAASARGELNHLFGPGVVRFCGRNFIFNASENAELSLNGYVELMSVVNDLLGQCDILFEGKVRTVNHHRGETIVDALLANLEGVTMVEVKNNLRILATEFLGVLNSTLGKVAEDGTVGISASTLRNLHDDGRLGLNSSLNDSLHLLHCVEVEREPIFRLLWGPETGRELVQNKFSARAADRRAHECAGEALPVHRRDPC